MITDKDIELTREDLTPLGLKIPIVDLDLSHINTLTRNSILEAHSIIYRDYITISPKTKVLKDRFNLYA